MVKELLEEAVTKFNRSVENDPKLKAEVADKVRTVQLLLDEGPSYHFVLDHGHIDGVRDGGYDGGGQGADVTIETDEATIRGIFNGSVNPMRAYATKKLRMKASLQDLLTLRKLF